MPQPKNVTQHRQIDGKQPARRNAGLFAATSVSQGPAHSDCTATSPAIGEEAQRRQTLKVVMAKDLAITERCTMCRRYCAGGVARHGPGDQGRGQRQQPCHDPEQSAPADHGQQPLHRQRRSHHAERAGHQHPRIGAQLRGGRKRWRYAVSGAIRQAETPTPISARAASSEAKLRASANAAQASTASARKITRTRRGPWRSSARPKRKLHQCEAEEIGAGKQAEVARRQVELGAERRRQCRRHRTQQRRKEVGERERREHHGSGARAGRRGQQR